MITDADGLLTARFAALRDDVDDADWRDVLARRGPRLTRRTRRLVIALAVIAVAIPTALAFGGVRGFFFGTPAPPLIRGAFATQNEMRKMELQWQRAHHVKFNVMPEVNGHRAHGILAVNTSDGPLMLWAAPAAHGLQCWFVEFANDRIGHRRATGGGGCDTTPPLPSKIDLGFGWSAAHPTLKVLDGKLYVGAATLTVFSPSGRYTVPVVHRFFLAAFPRDTKEPTKVVARDAKGRVVLTWTKRG